MSYSRNHIILSLLLTTLCSCNDMRWRKLPEEKDIVFEGEAKKPQQSAYRPGDSRDIQLDLTSSDAGAQEAKFKVVSWSVADGKQGTLDTSSLSLGRNTLHYTPQESGTHELTLKVAVEGEEASTQTFHYTIGVPAAEWQAVGRANSTGQITLTIADAPEAWHNEPWRIQSTRWSRGLEGRIANGLTQVQPGENTLPFILQEIALEELPQVHFNLQSPDRAFQSITVDLRGVCIVQLEETYCEEYIQTLSNHNTAVRQQTSIYQGNLTGNAREEAQRTLNALHETTTRLQGEANTQLERLVGNLNTLRTQDTTDLASLEARRNELQRERDELNASMRILQPMVGQLNTSDTGPIDPWGVLHEALEQEQFDEANMAPHIASPLLSDAVNREDNQVKTLLHLAIEQGQIALSRSLIRQGAELNVRDHTGSTPLQYATEANNQEAIALLLGSGAVQNLPPNWQLQGSYETAGNQIILTIGDAPGQPQQARNPQAQWLITNTTWSGGIDGQIPPNLVLQHGETRIHLNINVGTLTETPSMQLLLQGPDRAFQSIIIDLREVCVAILQEEERALTERSGTIDQYEQNTEEIFTIDEEGIYRLPPDTVTDPRINREKHNEVGTLLGRIEAFQAGYERDLRAFSSNLNTLEQAEVNENLPVFEANNKRLKDAIASLKSAQVQLQQQCTTAHEALFKTLQNEEQEASMILLDDPRLDVNAKDREEVSLLYRVICIGDRLAIEQIFEMVNLMLKNGANVTSKNTDSEWSILERAVCYGDYGVIELLLEHGANVNARDKYGYTALHQAALFGRREIVTLLIEKCANVNAISKSNHRPLHEAARNGELGVVEVLLEHGAVVNATTTHGETALNMALESGHTRVANLLRQVGD